MNERCSKPSLLSVFSFVTVICLILCAAFLIPSLLIPQKAKLRIGVMPDVDSIQAVVAADMCKDAELVYFSSAVARSAAFRSGSIDVCVSDLITAVTELNSGFDERILTVTSGRYCLVSDCSDITELNGKKIAISSGTVIEYTAWRLLKDINVQTVPVPVISARYEALKNGDADAAVLPEPHATSAALDGFNILNSLENSGVGVLVGRTEALTAKSDIVSSFLSAWDTAADMINKSAGGDGLLISDAAQRLSLAENGIKNILPQYSPVFLPPEDAVNSVCEYLAYIRVTETTVTYERVSRSFWS